MGSGLQHLTLDLAVRDLAGRGWPLFDREAAAEDAAQTLADAGLGDGLPLVVPTEAGLERFLTAVADSGGGAEVLGVFPPMRGALTCERPLRPCAPGTGAPPRIRWRRRLRFSGAKG